MRKQFALVGVLLLAVAGSGAFASGPSQTAPTPTATSDVLPSPPPPPTAPTAPDVSGTWDITRSWFRRCPRCSEPVIRGTAWEITQNGHDLRVDRGLRGTIEGYEIHLEGIETDGFNRFDFYYSRLYLSPDGLRITGEFVGSETIQNPCAPTPPIVTCFAHGGYFHAIRRSPAATYPPPPSPETPTATATTTSSPTQPAPTSSPTSSPTAPSARPAAIPPRYLPLISRPVLPPLAARESGPAVWPPE